jgi:hypothetical protein
MGNFIRPPGRGGGILQTDPFSIFAALNMSRTARVVTVVEQRNSLRGARFGGDDEGQND